MNTHKPKTKTTKNNLISLNEIKASQKSKQCNKFLNGDLNNAIVLKKGGCNV